MAPAKNWKPKGRAIDNASDLTATNNITSHSIYAFVRVQTYFYTINNGKKKKGRKKKKI